MSERVLDIGTQRYTQAVCLDEPNPKFGNACHKYGIRPKEHTSFDDTSFAHINFQEGPVKESGINGCHNEDLLAIVIDRLQYFQKGYFRFE